MTGSDIERKSAVLRALLTRDAILPILGVLFAASDNGDVAHVRPSGNADDLRIYAVADTQVRADAIAAIGVAEPPGILRRLQKAVAVNA